MLQVHARWIRHHTRVAARSFLCARDLLCLFWCLVSHCHWYANAAFLDPARVQLGAVDSEEGSLWICGEMRVPIWLCQSQGFLAFPRLDFLENLLFLGTRMVGFSRYIPRTQPGWCFLAAGLPSYYTSRKRSAGTSHGLIPQDSPLLRSLLGQRKLGSVHTELLGIPRAGIYPRRAKTETMMGHQMMV